MEDPSLGRIVQLVEAGEPLAPPDLARLEAALVRNPDSPDWLLCLAHAFVNGERPDRAVPLFDRVVRERPREVLARVGRARALGALERWDEARADLDMALSLSPGHADAMRAMAILRLKSGAPGEAARLARRVLETDPLDDPTRQILAEAEAALAAKPEPCAAADIEAFARALQSALTDRGVTSRIDAAAGTLQIGVRGRDRARLDLQALFDSWRSTTVGLDLGARRLAEELSSLKSSRAIPPLAEVRERLFPALRPRSFLAKSGPALAMDGPAGLVVLVAIDHAGFARFLPPDAHQRWEKTREELSRLAFENLDRSPVPPSTYRVRDGQIVPASTGPWDLVAFEAGDGYDASRLVAPAHVELLARAAHGPLIVALPTRAHALAARKDDRPAIALLRAIADQEAASPEGLTAELFALEAGILSPLP